VSSSLLHHISSMLLWFRVGSRGSRGSRGYQGHVLISPLAIHASASVSSKFGIFIVIWSGSSCLTVVRLSLLLRSAQANMDLNSLKDQVSNLTLYDIKAGVRKVQNGTLPESNIRAAADGTSSGDELYRNGVQGLSPTRRRTEDRSHSDHPRSEKQQIMNPGAPPPPSCKKSPMAHTACISALHRPSQR